MRAAERRDVIVEPRQLRPLADVISEERERLRMPRELALDATLRIAEAEKKPTISSEVFQHGLDGAVETSVGDRRLVLESSHHVASGVRRLNREHGATILRVVTESLNRRARLDNGGLWQEPFRVRFAE